MIPVYLEGADGRTGYSFAELERRFVEICEEHRASGRALAFAMILYDFRVPEVAKILNDPDYWRALHHLSGSALTVFSIHFEEPRRAASGTELRWMTSYSTQADPGSKAQLILKSYFGLQGRLRLPAVLFFQVQGGEVIDYHLWEMGASGVEATFQELREVIAVAVDAVAKVTEENRGNAQEIFNLVEARLKDRRLRTRILRGARALRDAKEAISFVTMLT